MQGQHQTGRIRRLEEIYEAGDENVEEREAQRVRQEDEASNDSSEIDEESSASFDSFLDDDFIDRLEIWSDTLNNWLKTGNALTSYTKKGQEYPTIFHALYQKDTETQEMFPSLLEEALDYHCHEELRVALAIDGLIQRLAQDPECRGVIESLYAEEAEASSGSSPAGGAGQASSNRAAASSTAPGQELDNAALAGIIGRPVAPPPAAVYAAGFAYAAIRPVALQPALPVQAAGVAAVPAIVMPPAANNAAARRFVIGSFVNEARPFERAQAEALPREAEAIRNARWRSVNKPM